MHDNHKRTIARLTEHFQDNPDFLALIIGGSVAKGWAADDADVDILLVATDEAYARYAARREYWYFNNTDFCDYPGGYIDGKIIDLSFLRDAADHGSEPARAAFWKAFTAFSHEPEVDALLERIPVYPEAERDAKLKAFYSLLEIMAWYVGEGERHNNPYLLTRMTSEIVLYAGRLILAYNRILYPYHKWLLRSLQDAPEKPDNLMDLIDTLLAHPCKANAEALRDCLKDFHDWGVDAYEANANLMLNVEWAWRNGPPPLADW
jgi:hypothetical protein